MGFEVSLTTAILAAALASGALTLALLYVASMPGTPSAARWWAAGFLLNTVRLVLVLSLPPSQSALCLWLSQSAQALGAVAIIAGTFGYAGMPRRKRAALWAAPVVVAWAAAFSLVRPDFFWLVTPLFAASGLALIYTGWLFIRIRPPYPRTGHRLVGHTMMLWGLHKLDYPLLRPLEWVAPYGFLLAALFAIALAVGFVMVLQRRLVFAAEEAARQHQQSDRRLAETEARYRDLVDNARHGILVARAGRPIFANAATARLLGYDAPAEVLRLTGVAGWVAPPDVARVQGYTDARLRGDPAPESYEFRALRADGDTIWLQNTVRMVEWEGAPAIQATLYDISARRRFGDALRESQRLLRSVFDHIPHWLFVKDAQGRFLLINRAMLDAHDLDESIVAQRPLDISSTITDEEREAVYALDRRVLEAGERVEEPELHITLPGHGTRVFRTLRVPLRDDDGTITGLLGIAEDITERLAIQNELQQAQKLEAVGRLTGGVAHDFNNLLNVVIGSLELLQGTLTAGGKGRTYVDRAMRAAERGALLTQRLLAFSRRHALEPRPVDLNRQIGDMLDLVRSSLGAPVRLETELSAVELVAVDAGQLENAVLNLVLNARDAMPDGGTLTLTLDQVAVDRETAKAGGFPAPGAYVCLSVADTGVGIPSAVQPQVVEPFFTTKPIGTGTGLGLSMVYGFARQSGGHLTLDSTEGAGTTVNLFFPVATGAMPPELPEATAAPREGSAQTVLVVEDDPELRAVVAGMIRLLNYETIEVADGTEALTHLQGNPEIALLFTDVVLPNGLDGVELAQEARRRQPDLPVLFTTGYATTVLERHQVTIPPESLVQKPFRLHELAEKISATLKPTRASA